MGSGVIKVNTHNPNKPTTQRHDGHAPGNSLHKHVLHGTKRKPEVLLHRLKDAEPEQTRRHRHDADPPRLQPKVHVREANDQTDGQPDHHAAESEAFSFDQRQTRSVGGRRAGEPGLGFAVTVRVRVGRLRVKAVDVWVGWEEGGLFIAMVAVTFWR